MYMAARLSRLPSLASHSLPNAFLFHPTVSTAGRSMHDRWSRFASSSTSSTTPYPASSSSLSSSKPFQQQQQQPPLHDSPPIVVPEELSPDAASPQVAARPPKPPVAERPKPQLKATKAAISLTPTAVSRLRALLSGPHPQLIRIGVRNKGCAGMSYHLEYVDKPGKFDEVVEQDGVRVLIDSKALFSIIGSEMDWVEDRISSKFAFKNPNIQDACGCGESFTVKV